jgi:hypothetical protein
MKVSTRNYDGSVTEDFYFGDDMRYDLRILSVNDAKMYRLNASDNSVVRCDDTPDGSFLGNKYMKSTMRKGQWVFLDCDRGIRSYINESEVPKPVLMAVLCGI